MPLFYPFSFAFAISLSIYLRIVRQGYFYPYIEN